MTHFKLLRVVAAVLGMTALATMSTACTHVKPWERGRLAHPDMVRDTAGPAEDHVNAVQEGAVGGATGVYFYIIFAAAFDLPTVGTSEFFHSDTISWVGVMFCMAGLLLLLWSIISFRKELSRRH